jgi:hypothetical protein
LDLLNIVKFAFHELLKAIHMPFISFI